MRIAVPSDDGVTIAGHTGRCGGFVIFDVNAPDVSRVEYRDNRFTAHALGQCDGHDHADGHEHDPAHEHHSHAPLLNALHDCEAMLTRGMGPRLVHDLAARGIRVYAAAVEDAREAAEQFAAGQLAEYTGGGCCHH